MTATIDPRMQQRRVEVEREASRRRWRVMALVGMVFVVLGLAYLTVESPLLDVDHVRVAGVRVLGEDDVRSAAGVEHGDALLRVDTGAVARRVEQLPWVADAQVDIDVPGTLRIAVEERVAVAYARRDAAVVALLDADGAVIADATVVPEGLPEVRGADELPAAGARLAPADAAAIAPAMPDALRARIAAIELTDGVRLLLHGGGEVRLCDTTELAAKGAAAVAVMERLGATPFTYIDVCVPRAPVSA